MPARFNWIGSPIRLDDVLVVWHTAGVRSIEDATKKQVIIGATTVDRHQLHLSEAHQRAGRHQVQDRHRIPGCRARSCSPWSAGEVDGHGSNPWGDWKATRPDWVRDKKIIPLMQMSLEKAPDLPEVPLLMSLAPNEQAREVFELMSITADIGRPFLTAPGVPADRVAALRQAFNETMTDPDFRADAAKGRKEVHLVTGQQLEVLVKRVLSAPKSAIDLMRAALAR